MMFELTPNEMARMGLAHEYDGAAAHDSDPTPQMQTLQAIEASRSDAFPQGITLLYLRDHYLPSARLSDLIALETDGLVIQIGAWWEITSKGIAVLDAATSPTPVVTHYALPPLALATLCERLTNLAVACAIEYGDDSHEYAQANALATSFGALLVIRRAEDGAAGK